MSTTAVRRTTAVLLASLLAAVVFHTVTARRAEADVRPARSDSAPSVVEQGTSRRPVVGPAVKYVRNGDGSVSRTR